MEFLRFGSSIPGEYWGCCAADIIQNLNQDPDTKASIQLVSGDGGGPIQSNGKQAFAGPTLKDIFLTRIRIGTFSTREMPNHAFFVIMNDSQCNSAIGKKWLALMKEQGFEYLRTVNNSVWNVNNHIFVLIRNCGPNRLRNVFTPPKTWTDLPTVVPETYTLLGDTKALSKQITDAHVSIWENSPKVQILSEDEITKAGAPVILAGLRTEFPPEPKHKREEKMAKRQAGELPFQPSAGTQHFY